MMGGKNTKANFQILDCTVRDGGYLNNWHFDKKMVKELYRSLSKTGVDIIELGFRNTVENSEAGPWHCVSEEMLEELVSGISGAAVGLMLDFDKADTKGIRRFDKSPVKIYRVACHKNKAVEAIRMCEDIKGKGYVTSIQLMGIVTYSQEDFDRVMKPLKESSLDYVYFADSYGSLLPQDISRYIKIFKQTGKKVGFHAHNGLQLAFANTLEAINNGIDIVDGTVYGMGRGAGNLPIEALITYLEKTLSHKKYNSMPVLDLIDRYFVALKHQLTWGYSLPYMLSGIFEVHPDYAKKIIDYHEYNMDDMVKVLEVVKGMAPVGFKTEIMERVINSGFVSSLGELEDSGHHNEQQLRRLINKYPLKYKDRHKDRDFLILANGPTLKEHKQDIDRFVKSYNPVVMGANYLGGLFKPDYHAFSNKKRFATYMEEVDRESALLLSTSFSERFIKDYTDRPYDRIVHLNRVSKNFEIKDDVITSNCRTISILMIAVAIVMGAKRIFIAGMDGYKSKENFLSKNVHFYRESDEAENFKLLMEKHNWNEMLLNGISSFLISQGKEGLHIITPTSHKYFYSSVYNWIK